MTELSGVIAAAATPLDGRGDIDLDRLVRHCKWLLEAGGCDAINLLGTTGEATSFTLQQRLSAMTTISRSGLPMARFMVGTGAAAIADAIALTKAANDLGFAGALLVDLTGGLWTGLIERIRRDRRSWDEARTEAERGTGRADAAPDRGADGTRQEHRRRV